MISLYESSIGPIPKNPFKMRINGKRSVVNWNPLTQPLGKNDYIALGIQPKNLGLVCQKLSDIRTKLSPKFLRDQLVNWFSNLSVEERIAALTLRVPSITWLIKQIFTRSMIFGDSLFAFEISQSTLSYTIAPDTTLFRNLPKTNVEREFIVGIRLASDKEPFDSLSVAKDLIEDTKIFFKQMEDATCNKFGLKACRLLKTDNTYTWELPDWFNYGKLNTVGSWICANLERILWLRYGMFLTQGKVEFPRLWFIKECEVLTEFWRGLDNEEKDKLFFDAGKVSIESLQEKTRSEIISAINVKEAAFNNEAGKFINWLFFNSLSDIGIHRIQTNLINELRKLRSNKAANELLNEETSSSDLERAKGKTILSDPEDSITIHKSKKAKINKQKTKNKKRKKKDKTTIDSYLLDDKGKVALDITSTLITEALNKVEEEENKVIEIIIKEPPNTPPMPISPKLKACKKQDQVKTVPIIVKQENLDTPSLDGAAVEVNYYKSAQLKGNTIKKTLYSSITEEINFLYKNLKLHRKKQSPYQTKLISTLKNKITTVLGENAEVQVYGSLKSGLDIESSDIDIGIAGVIIYSREDVIEYVNRLVEEFRSENYICGVEAIITARIPILKLVADMAKLFSDTELENLQKVDLTLSYQYYYPVEKGMQNVEVTKLLLSRYKYLKEVTIVLKKILAKEELNIPFKGGINSFGVLLLSAAYYSLYPDFKSPGEYLISIIDFYAKYFNNMLYGICFNGELVYSLILLIELTIFYLYLLIINA